MSEALDVASRFRNVGLAAPPIPADLAQHLAQTGELLFSTRPDGPGPYAFDWHVEELLAGRCVEPYLIVGHDGTGLNSWAMHYLLVRGALAVFDQIPWGGAYTDDDLAVSEIAAHWTQLADLIAATDRLAVDPRKVDPEQVVVMSGFGGSRWATGRLAHGWRWRSGGSLIVLLEAVIDAEERE